MNSMVVYLLAMIVVTQAQWFPFGYGHGLFGGYHPGFGYAPTPYRGFPPGFPYYGFPIFNPYTLIHPNNVIQTAPAPSFAVEEPAAAPSLSVPIQNPVTNESAVSGTPAETRVADESTVSGTPVEVPFIDESPVTDAPVTEILVTEDPVTEISSTDLPVTDVQVTDAPVTAAATVDGPAEVSSSAPIESPSSILTVPVADSPVVEVSPAPIQPPVPSVPINSLLPVPVQDTPEVAAAKREFAVLYAAAKAAAEAARTRAV